MTMNSVIFELDSDQWSAMMNGLVANASSWQMTGSLSHAQSGPRTLTFGNLVFVETTEKKSANDYRIQGIQLFQQKALQSLKRIEELGKYDPETMEWIREVSMGLVEGADLIISEIKKGTVPQKFQDILVD